MKRSWCVSCNILNRWRVSDDESRRVLSEGEGACSPLIKVRSHLASEREARMDDPTRWCENDTDKWKRATRGSCSQARAPLFCLPGLSGRPFPEKQDSDFCLLAASGAVRFNPQALRFRLSKTWKTKRANLLFWWRECSVDAAHG